MMQRAGWTPNSFAIGDAVSIDVNPVRNAERRMARGIVVRSSDGAALAFRGEAPVATRLAVPAEGLSGNWLPSSEPVARAFVGEPTGWSLTPKGLDALATSDPENDPGIDCVALQAPFQMMWTELKNIELAGDTVILRSALNVGVERIVRLDQTTHDGAPFSNRRTLDRSLG